MNTERDKFLTEAMGECWHNIIRTDIPRHTCTRCGEGHDALFDFNPHNNFSTWEGFGKLWEWVSLQENMMCGLSSRYNGEQAKIKLIYINPDNFANAVYTYLKEQK